MLMDFVWLALVLLGATNPTTAADAALPLLIVGSVNADSTIAVERLPSRGECVTSTKNNASMAVGGKGANQAVAAARLRAPGAPAPLFAGRFGGDSLGSWMISELSAAGVNTSASTVVQGAASGAGVVWLDAAGAATSVVVGGANKQGWGEDPSALRAEAERLVGGGGGGSGSAGAAGKAAGSAVRVGAVLLQREVPEAVNEAFAAAASAAGAPVLLDAGGEDRSLEGRLLGLADYVCPNEHELARLTGMPVDTLPRARAAARALIAAGARSVLLTRGERGALLLLGGQGTAAPRELRQLAVPLPAGAAPVDATAAGDAFRAAFAVALAEGRPLRTALRFAAAAGAVAVTRGGAMPSLPSREEVEALLEANPEDVAPEEEEGVQGSSSEGGGGSAIGSWMWQPAQGRPNAPSACPAAGDADGGAGGTGTGTCAAQGVPGPGAGAAARCPLLFASRLNSMRARRDLIVGGGAGGAASGGGGGGAKDAEAVHQEGVGADNVLGWVARQGLVRGLDLVYFNYPEHLEGLTPERLRRALSDARLSAGGVALRFPSSAFASGAFTNPSAEARRAALALAASGCRWAEDLGASELVVWSAFDGYDYNLQADYDAAWGRLVSSFRELADACPKVNVSLEWKPTDPSSRYSFVPSTAAALLLATQVDRSNFGLTLDTGHLLMAGENAAQSVAMVAAAGKLFGLHLNDGHSRVGAEDGLAFGSVHPVGALELVHWLRRKGYSGSIYFDTFPMNEDPVREAELNVRRFKAFWVRSAMLQASGIDRKLASHDAIGALEMLEQLEEHGLAGSSGWGGQ